MSYAYWMHKMREIYFLNKYTSHVRYNYDNRNYICFKVYFGII